MKKLNATLSLVALVLASLTFSKTTLAQQPPDNVQGNWTIYSTRIQDGATEIKHVQIAQYGNRITGYFEGPVQSGPIQGEVNIHHIRFSTVTRNVLNFRGQIYGDNMSGEYGLHGKHAQWQAVRTTGIGAAPQAMTTYGQSMLIPPAPQPAPVAVSYSQPSMYSQQGSYSQSSTYSQPSSSYAPQTNANDVQAQAPTPAPMSADQLDSLVAPIALYPDALVAQVLAAATVPDEVTAANQWMSQNTNLTGQNLEQAADQQDWDPSVKALTQFPSVLANLAHNLSWTSSLGQAFHFQQSDVLAAVQVMRANAQAAGTLQSSSQITVTTPAPNTIVIQPANPQVVYVPQYNPAIVYGAPIVVPMYTSPVVFAAPVLSFGVGVTFGGGGWAVGGGFGWGFHAWACNWGGWGGGGGGNTIIFNHNTYITNNTWHTANYNGYHTWGPGPNRPGGYVGHFGGATGSQNHAWYGNNGTFHPDGNYKPGQDTHYGPNGGYHPNGYFGPDGGWHQNKNAGQQVPNGGNNGNHGLIGGNNGVQNPNAGMNGPGVAPANGYHNDDRNLQARNDNRSNLGSSRMSGDGRTNRAESTRGHASMARQRPQHQVRQHTPAEHHFSGGGRRR